MLVFLALNQKSLHQPTKLLHRLLKVEVHLILSIFHIFPCSEVGSKSPEFALCFAGAGIYQLQSELQKRSLDLAPWRCLSRGAGQNNEQKDTKKEWKNMELVWLL